MHRVKLSLVFSDGYQWERIIYLPIAPFVGLQMFIDTFGGEGDFLDLTIHHIMWHEDEDIIEAQCKWTMKNGDVEYDEKQIAEEGIWKRED